MCAMSNWKDEVVYANGVTFKWSVPVYEDDDGYMYTTLYYYDGKWRSVKFPENCNKNRVVESIQKDFNELLKERNIDEVIGIMNQAFIENGNLDSVILGELKYYNVI